MSTGVTIALDEATPLLARVRSAAQVRGLLLVGGRAGASLVREHLFALDGQRGRSGRHFYAQAARSVTTGLVAEGIAISITQTGFRQRRFGGTIKPGRNISRITGRPTRFLTIPAEGAEGTRAGEYADLHLTKAVNPRTGALQWALVRNLSTPISLRRRTLKDGSIKTTITAKPTQGGEVVFWLAGQITQQPDPTVLPGDAAIIGRVTSVIQERVLRLARAGQLNTGDLPADPGPN